MYQICTSLVHLTMAKKKTTDKRLTFKNEHIRLMEQIAERKGMSVKKMLEFLVTQWVLTESR